MSGRLHRVVDFLNSHSPLSEPKPLDFDVCAFCAFLAFQLNGAPGDGVYNHRGGANPYIVYI